MCVCACVCAIQLVSQYLSTVILPHLGKQFFFSSDVEQPALQHVLHQKQAVRQSITCVRACVRMCMCSHTQRRSFSCHFQTNVISFKSEVGGAKQSGAEAPTGNPSPAPSASAPHARHDRSMARSSSEARAICGLFSYSPPGSRKYVPSIGRVSVVIRLMLARFYNGFAEDQLLLCSARLMKIRFS